METIQDAPEYILKAVEQGHNREERLRIFVAELNNYYQKFGFTADITRMRHSPLFAKTVFGLEIDPSLDPDLKGQGSWDNSTAVLIAAMLKYINQGDQLISIGSGPYAVEASVVSLEKKMPITVLEIYEPYIETSRMSIETNKADVTIIHSDLYKPFSDADRLPERADFITWNPPYVPTAAVKEKALFGQPADGGPTGRELMIRALRELPESYKDATLMFAVNTKWQSEEVMIKMAEDNGFHVTEVFGLPGSVSKVFIMKRVT